MAKITITKTDKNGTHIFITNSSSLGVYEFWFDIFASNEVKMLIKLIVDTVNKGEKLELDNCNE